MIEKKHKYVIGGNENLTVKYKIKDGTQSLNKLCREYRRYYVDMFDISPKSNKVFIFGNVIKTFDGMSVIKEKNNDNILVVYTSELEINSLVEISGYLTYRDNRWCILPNYIIDFSDVLDLSIGYIDNKVVVNSRFCRVYLIGKVIMISNNYFIIKTDYGFSVKCISKTKEVKKDSRIYIIGRIINCESDMMCIYCLVTKEVSDGVRDK